VDDYEIAVFENKFPSLSSPPPDSAYQGSQAVPSLPANGVCEVVCYSPEHNATLADLPPSQVRKLVRVWRERYADLSGRSGIGYVFIFENKGKEIGVTLSHPHGQIYAYPFVPKVVQIRLDAELSHYELTGRALVDDWLEGELLDGSRVIATVGDWAAVVPAFARYPYEVHIAPTQPYQTLTTLPEPALDDLAKILRDVAGRLDRLFGFSMPYIMSMYQHPAPHTRFVVEFAPPYRSADKLKYLAGSEAGCGVFINDTLPEESAEALRRA
jgi:UDPglucose--hexose-1-phosphate uridylyltransferase